MCSRWRHVGRTRASQWCRKELAHAILHEAFEDRRLAESAAYMICLNLGLETGDYTICYIAPWAGAGENAVAGIKAAREHIQKAVKRVLAALASEDQEVAA